ncbi:hypothetical protein VTJ04DRAFT_120 [Mycothermus thermophilus]|uniref:uncharacterized protein n=1 Tax=Humicola insolens TaxID=85995 RepID=UPI003742E9AA
MNHLGDFDTGSRTDAGHRHDGTGFGVVGLEAGRGKKRVERIKRERRRNRLMYQANFGDRRSVVMMEIDWDRNLALESRC